MCTSYMIYILYTIHNNNFPTVLVLSKQSMTPAIKTESTPAMGEGTRGGD